MLVRSSQSISDVYSQGNNCVSVTHKLTMRLEVQPRCSQQRVSKSQFEKVWSTRKGCPCQHLESSVLEFQECPLSANADGWGLSTPFPLSWALFQKSFLWVTESTWHLLCVGVSAACGRSREAGGSRTFTGVSCWVWSRFFSLLPWVACALGSSFVSSSYLM